MKRVRLGYNAVKTGSSRYAVLDILASGQFSPGEMCRDFEKKFAALHKAKFGVFVNSGTDALRIALLALKEKFGWSSTSAVAVPSVTFVATVNAVLQAGLKPVFIDVGMSDYCINPWNLERRGTDGLVAVLPVHLFGQSCGPDIYDLAKKNGLVVLEDSCETILNPLRGSVSCHSTYMAHHVTTGVGGVALTNDVDVMELMRSYANHGRNTGYLPGYVGSSGVPVTKDLLKRRFRFDRVGYSSRATEFEAALGLSQLDEKDLFHNITVRRFMATRLLRDLQEFPDLILPKPRNLDGSTHTWMMFPVVLREDSKVDKYDLCLHLEKAGIETRDMMPVTNQPCYKHLVKEEDFPVAQWINKNGFYIPVNPGMTEEDLGCIKQAFDGYFTNSKIKRSLIPA